MQFRKSLFILSFISCLFLSPAAFALQSGCFMYEVSGSDNITITGGVCYGGALVISDTIEGMPVVSIGAGAFNGFSGITSVTIPEKVQSIGDEAFAACAILLSINVDANNTAFSSQDGVLYNKNKTTLIQYPAGKSGVFTIPGSVTSIGNHAFSACTGLTDVTIPNSVVNIGVSAFAWCEGLSGISIPDSVTSIGDTAFYSCDGLTSFNIPSSVIRIGFRTLHCDNLISINVDANNAAFSSQDGVLYNINKTILIQYPAGKSGEFTIPETVTGIGFEAFRVCTGLTGIHLPNSLINIGESAFVGCKGLTSIGIPTSVISIGNGAFASCDGLTAVYFSGDAPVMGEGVFNYTLPCAGCTRNFTIYYTAGAAGFTNPWCLSGSPCYPTAVFTPSSTTTTITEDNTTTTTTTVDGKPCPAQKMLGENNPNLENLRDFRDSKLAQSAIGRKAIQIYYTNADCINAALDRSPTLRAVTRSLLEVIAPMVGGTQ